MAQAFVVDINLRVQQVLGLETVKQQLAGIQVGGVGQVQKLSTGLKTVSTTASIAAINTTKASKATTKLGRSAQKTGRQLGGATKQAKGFGDQIFLAGKRYAAFLGATVAAFKAFQLIGAATKSVIEFNQAMVSLAQIIDVPVDQLGDLSQQFLDLSTTTGTSAAEIANAAKLLAQAGFRGNELAEAVEQLAKVPLTPIFEGMEQAVDGAIAAMRQFSNEGLTVERVFDKMINVSNRYAASFPDIIEGLKRGGSAFQAIGGTLDDFIAAFTTIRSVTRESASAVGTSLKTVSTRLADPKIIRFLETKGIRLVEKGQFIGPLKAIEEIGEGLERTKNVQDKVNIAVRLGGRRQVSRFLALAQNMKTTNEILEFSKNSWGAFSKVAQQGLEAIGKQIDIMIAKGRKLAIELGEDLFIPFIKGLTGTAEAAISLLSTLKPIIPLLTKIGVLATGAALAGGIGGFFGSRLGKLAGPAAFAAAGGGLKGAGAGLAKSPFVQAGLLIAAAEVTTSFLKTTEGADTLASTLITSTALITAAIVLFRKQTITQFAMGGGLFPTLGKMGRLGAVGGALATVGAIALPLAIIQARKSAKELSDKIVDNAILSISKIEIDPTDPKSFEKGLRDLYQNIGQRVQELIKSADVRNDPNIKKSWQAVGRIFGNILEGDFEALTKRGGLTRRNIQDRVQRILKESPKIVNDLMNSISRSLIDIGGEIDKTPFIERKKLVEKGLELGYDFKGANEFASAIINSVGGLEVWTKRIRENSALLKIEADKREKIIGLTRIFIPPKLVGQLLQFSKAVDKTTKVISISAKLFETQIAEIEGGIQVPTFEFDFGTQQIQQFIRKGGLKELFTFTPDIPKFIGGISEIENLLDQLIINISNLPIDANLFEEIDKFFDFHDVSGAIQGNFLEFFDTIAEDIRLASEGKLIDISEIKKRFEKEFSGLGINASDAAVEAVGKFLKSTFAQIQDELNRLATVRRFELEVSVRPETQAAFLEQQLKRINIGTPNITDAANLLRGTIEELELIRKERAVIGGGRAGRGFLPTPRPGFFEGRGQRLADIVGDERVRRQVRDSFQEIVIESTNLKKKLAELRPGSEGFIDASKRARELARTTIELQTAMEALDKATRQALESEMQTLKLRQQFELRQVKIRIEERGVLDPLKTQRAIFNLQQEHIQEQIALQDKFDIIVEKDNLLRVNLAKEISQSTKTQVDVVQDFDISVNIFADATRIQVTTIDLMKQHIGDFGQAVVDFTNLGTGAQPIGGETDPRITPAQIKSGGVNIQQAYDEYNRLLNEGNASQKDMIGILNAIYDRQEQTQPTKQEPSVIQKEQERSTETNEKISQLTESLDGLRIVLNEPNELRLITDQHIDLDLSTLPSDISEEIRPILEEAVMIAAKTVTRKALESLAAKSESEAAIAAIDTAQELI